MGFIIGVLIIFALLAAIFGREIAQKGLVVTCGVVIALPAVIIVIWWLSNAWNNNSEFHSTVVKWVGIGVMLGVGALVKWLWNRAE